MPETNVGWVWLFESLKVGMAFAWPKAMWDGFGFLTIWGSAWPLDAKKQCGVVSLFEILIGMAFACQGPMWDGCGFLNFENRHGP